jgi:LacI family transcriptional regulator
MASGPRILLLLETNSACFRRCIQGIAAFARSAPDWSLHTAEPHATPAQALARCRPDAVIARHDPQTVKLIKRRRVPAVFVYPGEDGSGVGVDNNALGKLAANHLAELGLRHFGFYGFDWTRLQERLNGFAARLKELGHDSPHVLWPHLDDRGMWPLKNPALEKWLKSLPRPVGIFAGNDLLAFEAAQICRQCGIQVPEQVAILGADNDEMCCALAAPDLSSIQTPDELIGHTAASRLRRLLADEKVDESVVQLPPVRVVVRRSTDTTALGDPDLSDALAFIRENADKPIGVEDILKRVGISRRSLEGKFQKILSRTPLEEIRRVRIERARALLLDWNLQLAAVARGSGFESPEWLAEVFRRETGLSPTEYRKQNAIRTEK